MLVGYCINIFTIPENGKVFYTVYYILNAIAMAGINSATINLIYDYVDKEKRVGALALNSTLAGFVGFFTTLIVSSLVSYIQDNGNVFLDLHLYAQQVVSAVAVLVLIVLIIYLNTVVRKIKIEKKKISFLTDKDCFEYYSICHGDWHVDQGRYELLICRDANTVEFLWKVNINKT